MNDIVIIANYCYDFSASDNGRFLYIAKKLSKLHKVELITSNFYHISKKKRTHNNIFSLPFKVTFINEPGYNTNICLKRFYSHYIWGKNVMSYLNKRNKPDAIYCSIPSLTAPFLVSKYCNKNKVRFLVDIQDLWPEAFQMVFNPPLVNKLIYLPFKKMANKIYSNADEICAVSNTYVNRALSVNCKCNKGYTVFLGTNLDLFDENVKNNPVYKQSDELWLAYCGTLGASYDLTCVIDALDLIKNNVVKQPKFIVMGEGPKKNEFELYAKNKGIDVLFTGLLPYDKMCGLLASCDIVVNPITSGAAQSIINKHADYAASGLPVLNTQECKEYCDLVSQYNMGINCKNNDAEDLASNLIRLIENKDLRLLMGQNARRCAMERFNRKNTYDVIIDLLQH